LCDNDLIWQEGKAPDVVIEITSRSTRREDRGKKFEPYRDVLKVPGYFQFDPTEEDLGPAFQGARMRDGVYEPIPAVDGRLPSEGLGLRLECDGKTLRLYDPVNCSRLLTVNERIAEETAKAREQSARVREVSALVEAEAARANAAEAEADGLRRELDALRKRLSAGS
jgi:hypothetical protein